MCRAKKEFKPLKPFNRFAPFESEGRFNGSMFKQFNDRNGWLSGSVLRALKGLPRDPRTQNSFQPFKMFLSESLRRRAHPR